MRQLVLDFQVSSAHPGKDFCCKTCDKFLYTARIKKTEPYNVSSQEAYGGNELVTRTSQLTRKIQAACLLQDKEINSKVYPIQQGKKCDGKRLQTRAFKWIENPLIDGKKELTLTDQSFSQKYLIQLLPSPELLIGNESV